MEQNDGFVFYSSFAEAIRLIPDKEQQLNLFWAIVEYGLTGTPKNLEYPINLPYTQMMASIKSSSENYRKCKKLGKYGSLGGRPQKRKWIDREEAERRYEKLGSWRAVAESLGVSLDTIKRARKVWNGSGADGAKGCKTLNNNDNYNYHYHDNYNNALSNNSPLNAELSSTQREKATDAQETVQAKRTHPVFGYEVDENGFRK